MRSYLVFSAMKQVSNRFLLAKTAAHATRGFHKPGARIQDTTNYVLMCIGRANPIAQTNAGPTATNIPARLTRPAMAIAHHYKQLKVLVVHKSPHSLPEA